MKQLSGLDSQFLAMETRSVFGHVGSVCILDPTTAGEDFTLRQIAYVSLVLPPSELNETGPFPDVLDAVTGEDLSLLPRGG